VGIALEVIRGYFKYYETLRGSLGILKRKGGVVQVF